MKPITVEQACKTVGGKLLWGDPKAEIHGVHTDSRGVKEGELFVPIIGARVDAHEFIPDVLDQGASCIISSVQVDEDPKGRGACILVDDTLEALQSLAAWYRSLFVLPVIGVTGSVGKTSTKEMIGAVLQKKYNTLITYKNMNSQVGLPLMVFYLDDDTQMAVFEMGISMPDEMDHLVDIVAPAAAVMTNIGVSHIGNLKTRENICNQKGRIIRKFGKEGKLFACGNDDLYELISRNLPVDCCEGHCDTFFYGTKESFLGDGELTYYADDLKSVGDSEEFTFHYPGGEKKVKLSVMGEHNVCNAVVAIAIGLNYGVDIDDAIEAVGEYKPLEMRGQIKVVKGIHLIDDTYNASPDSIRSNLRALFSYPGEGRRIAVLGDVLELGEKSFDLHKSIGAFIENESASGRRLDAVFTVGNESGAIVDYVLEKTDIKAVRCQDNYELTQTLKSELKADDWVLLKGSRGMHLDEVVEALTKE